MLFRCCPNNKDIPQTTSHLFVLCTKLNVTMDASSINMIYLYHDLYVFEMMHGSIALCKHCSAKSPYGLDIYCQSRYRQKILFASKVNLK